MIKELTVPISGYDYVAYRVSWMLGKAPNTVLTATQLGTLEIEHDSRYDFT